MLRALCCAMALAMAGRAAAADCTWPAWDAFKRDLISADGRVIDPSLPQKPTTSEGQSYALFFALVANDRENFARLLEWTQNNLAGGDLDRHLPAWLWGDDGKGRWTVLDANNANDADLWLAYSLLEAGRLWQVPDYLGRGERLLARIQAQTLRRLPGLGALPLPGDLGFEAEQGWRLNPSYLPPQLLRRFAASDARWAEVAIGGLRLLREGAPLGLAPDWLLWRHEQGWAADPKSGSRGSYDAIRVYLWVGMLGEGAPERAGLQRHFAPMAELTARLGAPPENVDTTSGKTSGSGPAGFSAALLPLLAASEQHTALQQQRDRLHRHPPRRKNYYNRVLALFGMGWDERRYRFDADGRLLPSWEDACATEGN
ncbi:cellulose synthase complex periplasmic endoglucanase BcsZ [Azotobacter chroococcum]|jgi:endo-1,4-beta-D-glucanase Y|uniref:cellulase n=1 Tax=Azotobacter chroococcum TaxID=353 RepID=A0A4R1PZT7_9GAMM|nr:cellulose synthase complex periplasmic endoglucanase BcsZ [Azotobacter chroococcum]TBV96407.1 cellulase [Azotobacter chroococcum]TCL34039.1 cellulase (glycosyl hydrolase family 8) [Azotobacter chroococcum]